MSQLSPSMRVKQFVTVALGLLLFTAVANAGEKTIAFDIKPSRASKALNEFALQADVQLLYAYDLIADKKLQSLRGRYSIPDGISRLLDGSCLRAQLSSNGSWAITKDNNAKGPSSMLDNNKCKKTNLWSAITATFIAALLPVSADAQQEPVRASADTLLQEIIVTSRKKAAGEAVQDIPIAMSAFGGDQIEAMFAETVSDIGMRVPNVQLESQGTVPSVAAFFIRGMGAQDSIPSTDAAVGTFVDGMYLGVPWGVVTDVFDLESVEVLRGPQGTLFGRNVTGGAVLLNSRMPSGEFGLHVKTAAGSHKRGDLMFAIENGLTDQLSAKLSVLYKSNGDYYDNVVSGADDVGEAETFVARPIFSWKPTDTLSLDLISEFGSQKRDAAAVQLLPSSQALYGLKLDDFELANNFTPQVEVDWWHSILKGEWQVGNGSITSTTAYRELEASNVSLDIDGTPLTLFHAQDSDGATMEQHQFSQELVYAFSLNERIDITSGLYYFTQSFTNREDWLLFSSAIGGTFTDQSFGRVDHETTGAFVQTDIQLTDTLTTTIGGRYTKEEKSADIIAHFATAACSSNPLHPGCDFSGKETWHNFIPKVGLQWDIGDNLLAYASWTEGFRSGGFNIRTTDPTTTPGPYNEEEVEALEVGFKSNLANGRVILNVALFQNKYDDLQRTVTTPGITAAIEQRVLNAASATIKGIELDVTAAVTDNLVLIASMGYLDAEYGSFEGLDVSVPADGIPDPEQAAGLKLAHVPEWSYSLSANYDIPLENGLLTLRGAYSWIDDRFNDDRNSFILEDYGLLDASVSFRTADERWAVSLFGKNLTNEERYSNGFQFSFSSYKYLNPPRTYGLEIDYRY